MDRRAQTDIVDKAETRAKGDTPTPHFLGAIVLEPQARRSKAQRHEGIAA
jgi:hypothetical protein